MITLTAKIELSGAEWTNAPALISEPQTDTSNLFIIGESRLGEGAVFGSVSSGAKTEIVINQRNLINLESSIFDRSDIKMPSWGIISNGGRLEFNDPYGDVKDLVERNLLTINQKVHIYLTNTLTNVVEQVGEFFTADWEYDTNNKTASVTLKDDLEEWQEIMIDGINYDPRNATPKSAYFIYEYLQEKTPDKYGMPNPWELDDDTQNMLWNTIILNPFLSSGSLWTCWSKLCELCQLYIYKHITTKCVYNKGN